MRKLPPSGKKKRNIYVDLFKSKDIHMAAWTEGGQGEISAKGFLAGRGNYIVVGSLKIVI